MNGMGRIIAYSLMLSAPKKGNSTVWVMWGKAGKGKVYREL